ncbi:hypothetical protein D1BOALGB6SA_1209 [Olavius sp. associated proteobacterium Delta 1]|nr:hypothetical protein D1BOALGB6SA_1209 [Olavius sp. associated proteobacterium Delta 1]
MIIKAKYLNGKKDYSRFNIGFTAKSQSARRIDILCLPLRGRQT